MKIKPRLLAFTISAITLYLSFFIFYAAAHLPLSQNQTVIFSHINAALFGSLFVLRWNSNFSIRIFGGLVFIFFPLLIATQWQEPVNGASRWIFLLGMSFQPSEFLKLCIPCLLCSKRFYKTKAGYFLILTSFYLIIIQPDLSTALYLLAISIFTLHGNRISIKRLTIVAAATLLAIYGGFEYLQPHQKFRLLSWINPESFSINDLYQANASITTFFNSGNLSIEECYELFFGIHTDFAWTLLACSFGVAITCIIFSMVVLSKFFICATGFNKMNSVPVRLAVAIFSGNISVSCYSFLMALGKVPITGFQPPLIGYGGSGYIVTVMSLSLAIKILYENNNFRLKV